MFTTFTLFTSEGDWQVTCASTEKIPLQVHQVHFACSFMSLEYELVTFASSFMYIKFISAWPICNQASFVCQRSHPIAALGGWTARYWKTGCTASVTAS